MRRTITTFAVTAVLVMALGATAKATGTASDTVITNFATMTASGLSMVTSNSVNTSVQAVYGLSLWDETNSTDTTVTPGGYATYVVSVVNNGNTTDDIGVTVGARAYNGSPGTTTDWQVQLDDATPFVAGLTWNTSGATSADPAGDVATAALSISPGAAATFTIRVHAAADAVDSATMAFTLQVQTVNTPVGQYTGYNGSTYGGPASYARTVGSQGAATVTTTVNGAVLALSKSAVVDSSAMAGYTGGASDPVPGAKITYTITYNNTGAGSASTVLIRDYIPTNTTYLAASISTTGTDIAGGPGAMTDGADADGCDYNITVAGAVTCTATTIAGGNTGTVVYSVTID